MIIAQFDPFIQLKAFIAIGLFIVLVIFLIGFYFGWQWRDESEKLWTKQELERKLKTND